MNNENTANLDDIMTTLRPIPLILNDADIDLIKDLIRNPPKPNKHLLSIARRTRERFY